MILSDGEIRMAIHHGQLKITPSPQEKHYDPTSVDLTLGREIKRWRRTARGASFVVEPGVQGFKLEYLNEHLEVVQPESDGSVTLRAGDFVLAQTAERVEFPLASRFAARVEGRSTMARLGVGIHVTAPTIHCGFAGYITLEIVKHGDPPVKLMPGMRICQLIIEHVFGTPEQELRSAFQNQTSVIGHHG